VVVDSPALPSRCSSRTPIIVGGAAQEDAPLAATYASEFNLAFRSLADTVTSSTGCAAPARSRVGILVARLLGRPGAVLRCNEAEIERRATAIGRQVDELREHGLCGTPDEV